MDTENRNGLIYLMLFIMGFLFLVNFSSAVNLIETKTDTVRQNDPYIVKQFCVNSTYANISFISLSSQNVLGQTSMVEVSDDNYQYIFNDTSILGVYSLVSYCDENGIKVAGGQDFEVTSNGKSLNTQKTTIQTLLVPSLGSILALILIAISFAFTNEMAVKSLRYTGIVLAALNLFICFYLDVNDLLFILSGGVIAIGVGSLLEGD